MCGSAAGEGNGQGLSWQRPGTTSEDGACSAAGFGCTSGVSAGLG